MLSLQLLPLLFQLLEVPKRLLHFIGAVGDTLLNQLPEAVPRTLQVDSHTVKPRRRRDKQILVVHILTQTRYFYFVLS